MAEAKIVANQQVAGIKAGKQHAPDKVFGAAAGKVGVETLHPHRIQAAALTQQGEFVAQRGQPQRGGASLAAGEKFERLRLENNGDAAQLAAAGFVAQAFENVKVAEMHAVEVADGYRAALQGGRKLAAEPDFHSLGCR